jgi:hypothetical protein
MLNKKGEHNRSGQGRERPTRSYSFTHSFIDTTPFLVNHRWHKIIKYGHELMQSETMFLNSIQSYPNEL